MALVMDPLLSTVTLNVKKGKLRVESPEARIRQVTEYRLSYSMIVSYNYCIQSVDRRLSKMFMLDDLCFDVPYLFANLRLNETYFFH